MDRGEGSPAPTEESGGAAEAVLPPGRGRFGPYELIGEIGRGGMGVVYKARDPRRAELVAIKILLAEAYASADQVKRFRREGEILARLRHPGIVAVHEIGEADGKAYVAMEYVDGASLDKVLADAAQPPAASVAAHRRAGLDCRTAAGMTREIAEALHAAHQAGVIHRDLKPANVMRDRAGKLKLMDFGLAKLLDSSASGSTASGALLGTPQYMSPEQAEGRVRAVGARSDVYQLGALFYELLTGGPPHRGESTPEVLRKVVEEEPSPPRHIDPAIARDAETICLKCIEKDPARRYASAAAVAADLERFLAGGRIVARPFSTVARVWRKAVRGRSVVLPAAAAVGLGVALCTLILAGLARDARERDGQRLLEKGRVGVDNAFSYLYNKDAKYEELVRRVEEGQPFVEEAIRKLPDSAVGYYLLGRAWDLRGWEDRADECWRTAIEKDPRFSEAHFQRARLLLAKCFEAQLAASEEERAARRPEAEDLARQAQAELKTAAAGVGLQDPVARAVAEAMLAQSGGDLDGSAHLTRASLAKFGGQPGEEDLYWLLGVAVGGTAEGMGGLDRAIQIRPKHLHALFARANLHQAAGDLNAAIRDFDEALRINPRFTIALSNRGNARRAKGDLDGAIRDFDEALRINPGYAKALYNRGIARREKGDLDGAIADYGEALRINPRYVDALTNRGLARQAKGDLDGALRDHDEALRIHPRYAGGLTNRGAARQAKGDLDGAIRDYDEALGVDPSFEVALSNRGLCRQAKGDLDGALRDYDEALRMDPSYAEAFYNRGNALREKGDPNGAILAYEEALRLHPRNAQALTNRGLARAAKGDLEGAIQDYDDALLVDPRYLEALNNRGAARQAKGDLEGAIRDYDEALRIRAVLPAALYNRGLARAAKGDLNGALRDYDEFLRINPRSADAFTNRGLARQAKGDLDGAIRDHDEALRINPSYAGALTNRGSARRTQGDLDGAIRDFDEALRIDPRLPEALASRGLARQAKGDRAAAIRDWETLLQVAPPGWPHRQAVERLLAKARADK
ncbi:MAG: tetratricopeptide repeat protein [Planctomycetes bacterium]|nr:tetratricopeptide repeat protein [Planctomycetota bacterium]